MASFQDYLMDKIKDQIKEQINSHMDDCFRYHASHTTPKSAEAELKLIRNVDMRPKIGFEDFKIVDLVPTPENGDIIWKAAADMSAG